jgi:hypothetical protein
VRSSRSAYSNAKPGSAARCDGGKIEYALRLFDGSDGFREGNLYAVTFHGDVVELAGAAR